MAARATATADAGSKGAAGRIHKSAGNLDDASRMAVSASDAGPVRTALGIDFAAADSDYALPQRLGVGEAFARVGEISRADACAEGASRRSLDHASGYLYRAVALQIAAAYSGTPDAASRRKRPDYNLVDVVRLGVDVVGDAVCDDAAGVGIDLGVAVVVVLDVVEGVGDDGDVIKVRNGDGHVEIGYRKR